MDSNNIEEICKKAIPLPDCPVKKQDAIARRVWLKKQIEILIKEAKVDTSAYSY